MTPGKARLCRFVRLERVPMRDGTRLAASIFLPEAEGRHPVILQRTPYNRQGWTAGWEDWVKNGYIFICQDVRGRYDSEGDYAPFVQEIHDTPDTVAWIRKQDWCNGQVGMTGPSYLGWAQMLGVSHATGAVPDALVPTFMPSTPWLRGFYNSGPLSLFLTYTWACFDTGSRTGNSGFLDLFDVADLCRHLPLETLDEACGAGVNRLWREVMAHPVKDDYWESWTIQGRYHRFTMPTLNIGGWYDYYPQQALMTWKNLVEAAATPEIAAGHKVVIGPWGHHHGLEPTPDGQRALDFGPASKYDCQRLYRAWYDRLFKGKNPADGWGEKPVRIFVMGVNAWRDESEWPLARTRYVAYHLHSKGRANTLNGDGRLLPAPPRDESCDRYDYDPDKPVMGRGGNHSVGPWSNAYKTLIWCGPCDQRPNEERPDVLVYTGDELDRDLEVTGPVRLKLWASSSAPDTDFVGRLVDVHPDGKAINITEGIVRARYREGNWEKPALLTPGVEFEYTIDLQATSNVFLKGHRIRLEVTSSNFPLWDRNLNTGGDANRETKGQVAHQRILHDPAHPSRLILPVID